VALRHANERLQSEIEDLVVDHQRLMQRQTEEGAAYERRLDTLAQEVMQLRQHVN